MSKRLLLFLLFLPTLLFAQDHLSKIQGIKSLREAESYASAHEDVNIAFMHAEMNNEPYLSRMDSLEVGDSYEAHMYRIYIAAEGEKKLYRFRLISLTDQRKNNRAGVLADSITEELRSGTNFDTLFIRFAENPGGEFGILGDVGWTDLDYFIASFQDDLRGKHKGDIFVSHDYEKGWHNVVEMTDEPKTVTGHYVLFFPELSFINSQVTIDHAPRIEKLKTANEMVAYAQKNAADGVSLLLLNELANKEMYNEMAEVKKKTKRKKPIILNKDGARYRWVADTTVELYAFQYIFIDGSKYDKDAKNAMLNDIYARYSAGTPFDTLATEYWGSNSNQSRLEGIEGSLLMPEVTAKLNSTEVGQIFVARTSQSYFIGVPLRKPENAAAFLVIQYYPLP